MYRCNRCFLFLTLSLSHSVTVSVFLSLLLNIVFFFVSFSPLRFLVANVYTTSVVKRRSWSTAIDDENQYDETHLLYGTFIKRRWSSNGWLGSPWTVENVGLGRDVQSGWTNRTVRESTSSSQRLRRGRVVFLLYSSRFIIITVVR
jgi:hypothetical protein